MKNLYVLFILAQILLVNQLIAAQHQRTSAVATLAPMRLVAISESTATGMGGATFASFFPPFIDRRGHVFFAGRIAGSSTGDDGLWIERNETTKTLLAWEGTQAHDAPAGVLYAHAVPNFSPFYHGGPPPVVDSSGRLIFYSRIEGPSYVGSGMWYADQYGQVLLGYHGQPAPDFGTDRVLGPFNLQLRMNFSGVTLVHGSLEAPGTDVLWRTSLGGNLEVVDSFMMPAPSFPSGTKVAGPTSVVLNDAGNYGFTTTVFLYPGYYFPLGPCIFLERGGGLQPIVSYLDDVPGGAAADSFWYFDWLRMNRYGHIAFYGGTVQSGGVNGKSGLWAEQNGNLQLVTFMDAQAPGTPAGVKFLSFTQGGSTPEDIYYLSDDAVVYLARLKGTGVNSTNDVGIWRERDGLTELLAREGDPVSIADSSITFDSIDRLFANEHGDIVVFGKIKGPGITTGNNQGFWTLDSTGRLTSVVRTGDKLEIAPGVFRTFYQLRAGSDGLGLPSTGSDCKPVIFNAGRELTFQALFYDGAVMRDGIVVADLSRLIPSPIIVTRPATGDFWLTSAIDTIRWMSEDVSYVNVLFSANFDANTQSGAFDTVVSRYPAPQGKFAWQIPDSVISKKCAIRIEDADFPSLFDVSGTFKAKGYIITRDSAGQWEPFRFGQDTWVFGNSKQNIWPDAWWMQYNYQLGNDPFLPGPTSFPQDPAKPFWNAHSQDFPDWVSLVRAFGVNKCYLSFPPGPVVYNPAALALWKSIKKNWRGSCFGFSISSLLAFDDSAAYRGRYTTMPSFQTLRTVPLIAETRSIINELFVHQFGKPHLNVIQNRLNNSPSQTVEMIKLALGQDINNYPSIAILNNGPNGGGHSIVAYRAIRDTLIPGYWIHVYDNAYPDDSLARIRVDTLDNAGSGSWIYDNWPGWGGQKYLALLDDAGDYLAPPGLTNEPVNRPFSAGPGRMNLFTPHDASVLIVNDTGDSLGFSDSLLIDRYAGAAPLFALTGSTSDPYAYTLPFEPIVMRMTGMPDSNVAASFFTDSAIISYARTDAIASQTDLLRFDGDLAVKNGDPAPKSISLDAVFIKSQTHNRLFSIRNLTLGPNDSMNIVRLADEELKLLNAGGAKSYDLSIEGATPAGNPSFRHDNITFEADAAHFVSPDWSDLTNPVRILIDRGNDGSIDDTLDVVTSVGAPGGPPPAVPTAFFLEQNYPNPFNPATVIRYQLPVQSRVTLKIYDLLGQEIETLVNQMQGAGVYAVTWNAQRYPSGVYIYTLHAGTFSQVRKLMLLK